MFGLLLANQKCWCHWWHFLEDDVMTKTVVNLFKIQPYMVTSWRRCEKRKLINLRNMMTWIYRAGMTHWYDFYRIRKHDSGLSLRKETTLWATSWKSNHLKVRANNTVSWVDDLRFDLSVFITHSDTSPEETIEMFVFVTIEAAVLQSHHYS